LFKIRSIWTEVRNEIKSVDLVLANIIFNM